MRRCRPKLASLLAPLLCAVLTLSVKLQPSKPASSGFAMEHVGAWTGSMEQLVDASEPILDSSAPSGDTAKRGPEALVAAGKRSYGFQVKRRSEAPSGARSEPAQHRVRPCLPASSLKC
jgi:hypothetical protein